MFRWINPAWWRQRREAKEAALNAINEKAGEVLREYARRKQEKAPGEYWKTFEQNNDIMNEYNRLRHAGLMEEYVRHYMATVEYSAGSMLHGSSYWMQEQDRLAEEARHQCYLRGGNAVAQEMVMFKVYSRYEDNKPKY